MTKQFAIVLMTLFACLLLQAKSEATQPNADATCDTLAEYTAEALAASMIFEAYSYIQTAQYVRTRSGLDCQKQFFDEAISGNAHVFSIFTRPAIVGNQEQGPRIWHHYEIGELWKLAAQEKPDNILGILKHIDSNQPTGWDYDKYMKLLPALGAQTPESVFQQFGISTTEQ